MSRSKAVPREPYKANFISHKEQEERAICQMSTPTFFANISELQIVSLLLATRCVVTRPHRIQLIPVFLCPGRVANSSNGKKKSPVLRRLPESFRPGQRGILALFFKSSLTTCLLVSFLPVASSSLLFLCSSGSCTPRAPWLVFTQPSVMQSLCLAMQRVLLWPFLCRWPETETGSPQRK